MDDDLKAKRAAYMREYTRKNAEKINADRRARYAKNPEAILSAQREYNAQAHVKERMKSYIVSYFKNPEKVERRKVLEARPEVRVRKRELDKQYRESLGEKYKKAQREKYYADRQKVIDRNREWRRKNPEKVLAKNQRRRAAKSNVIVEPVQPSFIYERDRGICWLCRLPVEKKAMTLDHVVPLSKGGPHTEANLALAHRSCNSSKGSKIITMNRGI